MRYVAGCVVGMLVAAAPASAQVFVQTPWTWIRVGPPGPGQVLVQTPWATIGVNRGAPPAPAIAAPPPGDPTYVPGAPPPVPLPIPVQAVPERPLTLSEFAASFKPNPKGGRYDVVIVHPLTGKPVQVSFTLPEGLPRRVNVHRRELEFEYRGRDVAIHFLRGGEVRVRD